MKLDRIDRKILAVLQEDATTPVARIAEKVGLSQTPCWTRIRKLESAGIILGRVAIIDPEKMGLTTTVFVCVEAPEHTDSWRETFLHKAQNMDAVRDIYRMAGSFDYLLQVVVPDIPAFDAFYADLTRSVKIRSVNSLIAMERVKTSTAYAVPECQPG